MFNEYLTTGVYSDDQRVGTIDQQLNDVVQSRIQQQLQEKPSPVARGVPVKGVKTYPLVVVLLKELLVRSVVEGGEVTEGR
jgi:hypothetical protein